MMHRIICALLLLCLHVHASTEEFIRDAAAAAASPTATEEAGVSPVFHSLGAIVPAILIPNGAAPNGDEGTLRVAFKENTFSVPRVSHILAKVTNGVPCGYSKRSKNEQAHTKCKLYDRHGEPISTWGDLLLNYKETLPVYGGNGGDVHVHLVAPDDNFIFPHGTIGEKFTLRDTKMTHPVEGKPITLTRVSNSPRVFQLDNFFDQSEQDTLLSKVEPSRYLSSTAFNHEKGEFGPATTRTSVNAWDVDSPMAKTFMKRAFKLLGMPYKRNRADGLQIVCYNTTQAYIPHHDWLNNQTASDFNFDTATASGSNRFATVLVYLSDVELGGQTVFPDAPKADSILFPEYSKAIGDPAAYVKAAEEAGIVSGSWQHTMVKDCANKLSVSPKKLSAVLFYNQGPHGFVDERSLHGGCPVIKGLKYAANLWIWNKERYLAGQRSQEQAREEAAVADDSVSGGDDHGEISPAAVNACAPFTFKAKADRHRGPQDAVEDGQKVTLKIVNVDIHSVVLHGFGTYGDPSFTAFGPIDTAEEKVYNSYPGHVFTVYVDDPSSLSGRVEVARVRVTHAGQYQVAYLQRTKLTRFCPRGFHLKSEQSLQEQKVAAAENEAGRVRGVLEKITDFVLSSSLF